MDSALSSEAWNCILARSVLTWCFFSEPNWLTSSALKLASMADSRSWLRERKSSHTIELPKGHLAWRLARLMKDFAYFSGRFLRRISAFMSSSVTTVMSTPATNGWNMGRLTHRSPSFFEVRMPNGPDRFVTDASFSSFVVRSRNPPHTENRQLSNSSSSSSTIEILPFTSLSSFSTSRSSRVSRAFSLVALSRPLLTISARFSGLLVSSTASLQYLYARQSPGLYSKSSLFWS
mmetsp:Transcript_14220/g.35828  ORF Transcript_14220/g.35828 Transcript_14220/m.35828 type:complete len:234 (+) Transcript_14220:895-1596(+)